MSQAGIGFVYDDFIESVLDAHPKRADVWAVFVDKETKAGQVDAARALGVDLEALDPPVRDRVVVLLRVLDDLLVVVGDGALARLTACLVAKSGKRVVRLRRDEVVDEGDHLLLERRLEHALQQPLELVEEPREGGALELDVELVERRRRPLEVHRRRQVRALVDRQLERRA